MKVLREVYEKKTPYTFVPDSIRQKARTAFDKGIECILKTQVRQNGKLTVWCATQISSELRIVESTLKQSTWIIEKNLSQPNSLRNIIMPIVSGNNLVVGSGIAFVP